MGLFSLVLKSPSTRFNATTLIKSRRWLLLDRQLTRLQQV